jgi:hypothetical protein
MTLCVFEGHGIMREVNNYSRAEYINLKEAEVVVKSHYVEVRHSPYPHLLLGSILSSSWVYPLSFLGIFLHTLLAPVHWLQHLLLCCSWQPYFTSNDVMQAVRVHCVVSEMGAVSWCMWVV